jgi:hypothetical protein
VVDIMTLYWRGRASERGRGSPSIVEGEVLKKGKSKIVGDVVSKREPDNIKNRFIEAGAQAK